MNGGNITSDKGQIALTSAIIGASAVLLVQLLIFVLNRYKDKSNLIKELLSEERRLSYLITELYKELVMHKVHKQYWYKTSIILDSDDEDKKDSHQRHFVSNQKAFETMSKIRDVNSQYIKVVNHFMSLTSFQEKILDKIEEIKNFVPRKASKFEDVITYEELLEQQGTEEKELYEVYSFYSKSYDFIYKQMKNELIF